MAGVPLIIYGQVTESGTGVNAITVRIRNESTNEIGTATTNSDGLYIIDISDEVQFPSGWTDGDQVTVYSIYSNFEGQETIQIAVPTYGYEQDIALSAVSDSNLIDYCTVQDVYDELDGKTAVDISTSRIIKAIQRAEGIIDLKAGTAFKSSTATDEVHTADRYSLDISPDYRDSYGSGTNLRADTMASNTNNRIKVSNTPIISVTSLSVNGSGSASADDWTELTEQEGSGGDYVVESKEAGIIDFLTSYPRIGKRSWKVTYTWGYDRDSTDRKVISILKAVERIAVLLASKQIITTKSTGSLFDSTRDVRIGTIEIRTGGASTTQYLNSIDSELMDLWKTLGDFNIEVI